MVPTLLCAFKTAKPVLEEKYGIKIPQIGNDKFSLLIPNFKSKPNPRLSEMGHIYQSLRFEKATADDLMRLEKQHLYATDFDYEIKDEGIQINVSKLFKLIFQTCYGDNTSMHMLMDMLAPLFREVAGGNAIIKIATILAKGRKDKIFFHMSNLVRLIIVGMITDKIEKKAQYAEEDDEVELTPEDIQRFANSFNLTEGLVNGVVNWVKGALLLLNKNSANIKIARYREVFYGM